MANPYLSEIKYNGFPSEDFIEVVVDGGTDVSDLVVTVYRADGTIRTTHSIDSLTPTTIHGKDVYVIDETTDGGFEGVGAFSAVSLSDDSTVYSFVSFDDGAGPLTATEGAASGLTSTDIGEAGEDQSLETTDDGATYSAQTAPNAGSIPCFTSGTDISTLKGNVPVEDLVPGAMVVNGKGAQSRLLAVYNRNLRRSELIRNPKLFPVRISVGALGQGLPQRDLLVSRQHRMLLNSKLVSRMFGVAEVFIPAIKLIGLPGIYIDTSVQSVTYFHLLFSTHEVIFAEGAPTESLFLGEEVMRSLPKDVTSEINAIFPELLRRGNDILPCRLVPKGSKQKQLISRHAENQKVLLNDLQTRQGNA